MIETIERLSNAVIALLDEAGWPALRAAPNGDTGRIFLVDSHKVDQYMPPRITMLPVGTKVSAKDPTRGTVRAAANANGYDEGSRAAINNPAVATKEITFEVRCWGIASDDEDDPYGRDFEYTEALQDAIVTAATAIMGGCFKVGDGDWRTVAHVARVGRELVFEMTINMPITKRMSRPASHPSGAARPLPNAPADVGMVETDAMVIGSPGPGNVHNPGQSSPGCGG